MSAAQPSGGTAPPPLTSPRVTVAEILSPINTLISTLETTRPKLQLIIQELAQLRKDLGIVQRAIVELSQLSTTARSVLESLGAQARMLRKQVAVKDMARAMEQEAVEVAQEELTRLKKELEEWRWRELEHLRRDLDRSE